MAGTRREWEDWTDAESDVDGEGAEREVAERAGTEREVDERLNAGVEHLQRAAKEAISATRALLDGAEVLVAAPRTGRGLLGALGSVAEAATGLAARGRPDRGPDGPDDDPGVQRIPVSGRSRSSGSASTAPCTDSATYDAASNPDRSAWRCRGRHQRGPRP